MIKQKGEHCRMKRKGIYLLSFIILLGATGCTSPEIDKMVALKKDNEYLKEEYDKCYQKVDLIVSGEFTVNIHELFSNNPDDGQKKDAALANFFQSEMFILPLGENTAKLLKQNKTYTFKIKEGSVIKSFNAVIYRKNKMKIESILRRNGVQYELVGEAKESDMGLNSNRIIYEEKGN